MGEDQQLSLGLSLLFLLRERETCHFSMPELPPEPKEREGTRDNFQLPLSFYLFILAAESAVR